MKNAVYAANRERSVGLGVMGFHSFLQSKMVPMEGVMAKSWNKRIFKHIKEQADKASVLLAKEKGACPDAIDAGIMERFSNKIAIAPTASISVIAGNSSPGIEPYVANVFTQKTLSGSFVVKNKYLAKLLARKGKDLPDVWSSITTSHGSVQHLTFLSEEEKLVFKTAFEINQMWLVEHCADRTPFICQAQSFNLFFHGNINKKELHISHFESWKKGIKSLYYCRSTSVKRADTVSKFADVTYAVTENGEDCIACQ
jgi:ribonucleoside-diphosphate reductase alpha chain